uniref:Putative nucleotide protein n=1 Tax=Yichang virus TaxID=2053026 RepID=A0A7T0IGN9_9NIDO|nr:putative nucleotide protein [Yichang virus]
MPGRTNTANPSPNGANKPRVNKQETKANPGKASTSNTPKTSPRRRQQPRNNNNQPSQQQQQQQQRPQPKRNQNNNNNRPQQPQGQRNPSRKQAIGPNYVDQDGKRYNIGREYDARNHMGWRKLEKVGSSAQFMFIPKMVSRVDQCYYRTHHISSDGSIDTFAVGIYVQDSTLPRNVLRRPQQLTAEQKHAFLQQLDAAFNACLTRVQNAFNTDNPADYVITVDP